MVNQYCGIGHRPHHNHSALSTNSNTANEQTSKRPRTKPPERHKQKDKNVSMTPSGQFAAGIRNVTHSLPARPPLRGPGGAPPARVVCGRSCSPPPPPPGGAMLTFPGCMCRRSHGAYQRRRPGRKPHRHSRTRGRPR